MTSLQTSLSQSELVDYVGRQLNGSWPDNTPVGSLELLPLIGRALERIEYCFKHIRAKYYWDSERQGPVFSHLMGDQYASFLYFLSREARAAGNDQLAAKIYGLNRSLHGLDVYYDVCLPDIFCFQHTVGTVLGRANYGDYLFIYQRVTVGGNLQLQYPEIGQGVVLFGGVNLVGNSRIGDNVFFSLNTVCIDQDIEGSALVFGQSPGLTIKPTSRSVVQEMFHRLS